MASLFRNTRSLMTRFACVRRTAATTHNVTAGTQVRTSGVSASLSPASRSANGAEMAVRDARQRSTPSDAYKSRPAGETPLVPLLGKSLSIGGKIGFGVVLTLSAYFIYINYITNPEFYKSLKLSREAGQRGSHEQPADRAGTIGQKIDDAGTPKGELNKHL